MSTPLAERLAPCGPVVDAETATRVRERLQSSDRVETAWPALAPAFAAAPYLASLAARRPERLERLLASTPDASLALVLDRTYAADEAELRRLKGDLHLLAALCDLGGVWALEAVTGALSDFADRATRRALAIAAREAADAGRLTSVEGAPEGLFVLGMGKLGAGELNYSSDIDLIVLFDPERLPVVPGVEPQAAANRLTERMAAILAKRTAEGYVFRVDLRLRPDPSSTPLAVSLPAAFVYYESVGQNWERAAFIKARAMAGDVAAGEVFLAELQPFIWRRNLDFAAIADIHSIKRQIHAYKADERLTAAGADLKLGRGGIREIEFFVQTQQLILGGRQPSLRGRGTLAMLGELTRLRHVKVEDAETLAEVYRRLRGLEHRVQMVADEQTHRLPEDPDRRRAIAALAGNKTLRAFDAGVERLLTRVNRIYGVLFAGEESLSSRFGSLVFTGVEDDPETLATMARMGFADGPRVSGVIRAWHHGRIAATRTERGRELLTRLAPRLLDAAAATGAPDAAFARFEGFFSRIAVGVQLQSLLIAKPALLELLVRVLAFAPGFARALARRPAVLDALLDPGFFTHPDITAEVAGRVTGEDFEAVMDAARRVHAELSFRVGVQLLGGAIDAEAAGALFADLADALIAALARASLTEVERTAGAFAGEVAVIALGKCGSREMTIGSDLDLMTLYWPALVGASSALKGWSADTFYARITQRLVTALSAPTREGGLYTVDLRLRPSGTQGPVAVSLTAFERYYAEASETWELLAMTRARVVWATSDAFADTARAAIDAALRRPRDAAATIRDAREMRALMASERAPSGFWDLKLSDGGQVDVEFCAQLLQLLGAPGGGPLDANTDEALLALAAAEPGRTDALGALRQAWRLNQALSQVLKLALEDEIDVASEPRGFKTLLTRAGGARTFMDLERALDNARNAVSTIFAELTRQSEA